MSIGIKLNMLKRFYGVFDGFTRNMSLACEKFCSSCCTANVIMTTLEAYNIVTGLDKAGLDQMVEKLEKTRGNKRFRPLVTTNRLAAILISGKEPPCEFSDPSWGPCPLLKNNECTIYDLRPFGCRAMISNGNCKTKGFAVMEPFTVTVNDIFLQYIEHIDSEGFSGNLTDVLLFMAKNENRKAYRENSIDKNPFGLIPNLPVKALMIPPEHRKRAQAVIRSLHGA